MNFNELTTQFYIDKLIKDHIKHSTPIINNNIKGKLIGIFIPMKKDSNIYKPIGGIKLCKE